LRTAIASFIRLAAAGNCFGACYFTPNSAMRRRGNPLRRAVRAIDEIGLP
jgi:hypothetical protein